MNYWAASAGHFDLANGRVSTTYKPGTWGTEAARGTGFDLTVEESSRTILMAEAWGLYWSETVTPRRWFTGALGRRAKYAGSAFWRRNRRDRFPGSMANERPRNGAGHIWFNQIVYPRIAIHAAHWQCWRSRVQQTSAWPMATLSKLQQSRFWIGQLEGPPNKLLWSPADRRIEPNP